MLPAERPLADSAEESPYIHPASKARFGTQHKGISAQQPHKDDGMPAATQTATAFHQYGSTQLLSICTAATIMQEQPE